MFAIVAFPGFSAGGARVARWRSTFDEEMTARVDAHVTLVFPTESAEPAVLAMEADRVSAMTGPVEFICDHVMIWPEQNSAETLLFALPEGCLGTLSGLHRALHVGELAGNLRTDLPFVPHITVGRFTSRKAAAVAADQINAERPHIEGRIDAIAVVKLGTHIEPVSRHPLSGAGAVAG